jgi:hypothetical protein
VFWSTIYSGFFKKKINPVYFTEQWLPGILLLLGYFILLLTWTQNFKSQDKDFLWKVEDSVFVRPACIRRSYNVFPRTGAFPCPSPDCNKVHSLILQSNGLKALSQQTVHAFSWRERKASAPQALQMGSPGTEPGHGPSTSGCQVGGQCPSQAVTAHSMDASRDFSQEKHDALQGPTLNFSCVSTSTRE